MTVPLRIGVISSVAHRTPPLDYGPWEQVASTVTEGLVALGHDVTLFATADSLTRAALEACVPAGYEERPGQDAKVLETLHLAAAFRDTARFDVLLNHFDFLPLAFAQQVTTPMVTTVHGIGSPAVLHAYERLSADAHLVAISEADRKPTLRYAATIPHGIDPSSFTFVDREGDYLLFLGRIHPHKGTHRAIEVARRCGLPLVVAGIVQDADYFQAYVEPHLGAGVTYVGSAGPQERDRLLGGALGLLHLVEFDEPFGLAVVEALATGTPVVAQARGALPEIVRDGVTGFLVDGPDPIGAACSAVGRLSALSRSACRTDVLERFSAQRMVADYAAVLRRVAGR